MLPDRATCPQQRDRLVGVQNPVVLKRKIRLPMGVQMAPGLWGRVHARHIAMGKDCQHSGSLLHLGCVDRGRPPIRNRALDDNAVNGALDRNVGRIVCSATHFEASVDSGDWLSDGVHTRAPAVSSARSATRWASSILNPFCASGRASANDVAIAVLSASVLSSDMPRNADSAAFRRHGLCATPPIASRADSMRPSRTATAAAADTSANSYDWRSRSLK